MWAAQVLRDTKGGVLGLVVMFSFCFLKLLSVRDDIELPAGKMI